jgi:hypothetical protein
VSTTDQANTHAVFKAYDVRGTVPDQIDEELCRRTGAAFVRVAGASTIGRPASRTASASASRSSCDGGIVLGSGASRSTSHPRGAESRSPWTSHRS